MSSVEPGARLTVNCPMCQKQFQMKLLGRCYEGSCSCGEHWQMPKDGLRKMVKPASQKQRALQDLLALLDHLYVDYFSKNKQPGMMEALRLWPQIMRKYETFRNAQ